MSINCVMAKCTVVVAVGIVETVSIGCNHHSKLLSSTTQNYNRLPRHADFGLELAFLHTCSPDLLDLIPLKKVLLGGSSYDASLSICINLNIKFITL